MEMPIARSVNSIGVTEIGHLGPAIRSEIAKKKQASVQVKVQVNSWSILCQFQMESSQTLKLNLNLI